MGEQTDQGRRRQRLLSVFQKHDVDGSGDVDITELKKIFNELSVKKSDEDIRSILKSCSTSGDSSKISFAQFEQLFSVSRLRDVFYEIDEDDSGLISSKEVSAAMRRLGYKLSDAQCNAMLKKVDTDHSGEISFDEFRVFFENLPLASLEAIAAHWADALFVTDCGTDMAPTIPSHGLKWWQTILAGGTAGILSRSLTAPLEKVKIVAQTGTSATGGGMRAELRSIVSNQGFKGLFAGNLTNCIRVFPTAGITCTVYLNLLRLTPADSELDPMEPVYRLLCAGTAALVANSLTYPLDLIRARLTVARGTGAGVSIAQSFRDILSHPQQGGIAGLYRGIAPTLMAVVPFIAIQNTTIDLLRDKAITAGYEPSAGLLMSVGACAGLVAQTVVYPLDVLRRRMQLANMDPTTTATTTTINAHSPNSSTPGASAANINANVVSDSAWLSIRQIVRNGGVKSLFAGIIPTFLKTVPTVATVALVTGSINQYFKQQNKQQH